MTVRIIGTARYLDGESRKLKVSVLDKGIVSEYTVKDPGKDFGSKFVCDLVARKKELRTNKVIVPKHISGTIDKKE